MMSKQAKATEKRENDDDSFRYAKDVENSGIRARRCDQQPNFTRFQKENSISPRGI